MSAEGQTMIYANPSVSSADGVVNIGHHTSQIGFMSYSLEHCRVKLNGKFIINVAHGQIQAHFYNVFDGDYTTFEILTPDVELAVYALG